MTEQKTPTQSDNPPRRRRTRLFPQTARVLVEPLLAPMAKKRGFGEVRILTHWEEIVGKKLAAQSRPLNIQGREGERSLVVAVNPAFATDLHYQQPQILQRIATYCGARIVTRLQILQQPLASVPSAPVNNQSANIDKPAFPAFPPLPAVKKESTVNLASSALTQATNKDTLAQSLHDLANALQEQ